MENNPLKQYFRRPSVYMKLPSGGAGYPEGSLVLPENGELPVYPMTAIDEITAKTPDALFNGVAVVELIRSCIPNIKDPWQVSNIDLDAILVAIKTASSESGEMDIDSQCPKCEDVSSFKINLGNVLAGLKPANYNDELVMGDLSIKFQPISFKAVNDASVEQFQLQSLFNQAESNANEDERAKTLKLALTKITDLTMSLLSKSIEYIKTPDGVVNENKFILEFLKNTDRNDYIKIRDYSANIRKDSEVKPIKISCPSCQNQYEQSITLNPTDFFE
jgi:hypothetical protein